MRGIDYIWLLLAGFGGGLAGSVAGLASLVSYPALLAVGVPAVSANVTNTMSLVWSAAGAVWGFRPELSDQARSVRRLVPAALAGGLSGAVLLLATPSSDFTRTVPILLGIASVAVLAPRRQGAVGRVDGAGRPGRVGRASMPNAPAASPADRSGRVANELAERVPGEHRGRFLVVAVFLVTIYGGYFGAGSGVILLALLLRGTVRSLTKNVALRNVLTGASNAIASVVFAAFGPVRWLAVLPLAAGFLVGGRLAPVVVRKVPPWPLRIVISCAGIGLAVHLGLDAY